MPVLRNTGSLWTRPAEIGPCMITTGGCAVGRLKSTHRGHAIIRTAASHACVCAQDDARMAELLKENTILKKAVQIQNARIQAKQGAEAELQQLRHMVTQYQEQMRKLEVHNYSLALHLQQATSTSNMLPRNPDVF